MILSITNVLVTTLIGILIGFIIKQIAEYKNIKSAIRGLLRSEMVKIYYQYKDIKTIPYYVKEAWNMNYDIYKGLQGNSFIEGLKIEIDKWEVI